MVGSRIVGGGHILIGSGISATPPRSLDGPAKPVGTILATLAEQGLVPIHAAVSEQLEAAARARRGWRPIGRALTSQFNKSTHHRSSQLPPLGAASGFWRGFSVAATARRGFRRAKASASIHGFCADSTAWGSNLRGVARLPLPPPRGIRRAAQRGAAASAGTAHARPHATRSRSACTSPHHARRACATPSPPPTRTPRRQTD